MNFTPSKWDLVFLLVMGIGLFVLNELNLMEWLFKFPVITLLAVYYLGRLVSHRTALKSNK